MEGGKSMRRAAISVGVFLSLALVFSCQTPPEQKITRRLDDEVVPLIKKDMARFDIPGLSVAVLAEGEIVWEKGFGFRDRECNLPANPETVYRVGSISKLFNAVAIMQQVEKGYVDLDEDILTYLPWLRFDNPFDKPAVVTLRHLLSHKAGILRECAVGHYFDDSEPSMEATARSMAGTPLVYFPGSRTKYSNIGVGIAGHVLEVKTGMDFAAYQKDQVLKPLHMSSSSFLAEDFITEKAAKGYMRDLDGNQWEAPHFRFGHLPASNLYSNVQDLSAFMKCIFAGGKPVLESDTLRSMLTVQFDDREDATGVGLGFFISKIHGYRAVGHSGAVYGFSSNLLAVPDEKVGVVALNNLDGANGFNSKIVSRALAVALEEITGRGIADENGPGTVGISSEKLAGYRGRYERNGNPVWLTYKDNALYYQPYGTRKLLTPVSQTEFISDDPMGFGERIKILEEDNEVKGIEVNGRLFEKTAELPERTFPKWQRFIGDYGPDFNIMNVYVKDGKLTVLIEWFYEYPLIPVGDSQFKFPDYGLYMDEELEFLKEGDAVDALVGPVLFKRRR
jgi:CubicO group peptidase (beta-lactamase class C family)